MVIFFTHNPLRPHTPLTLVDKWSPALQVATVLLSIQALLSAPNPDDPLANDVASIWKSNEAAALRTGAAACVCLCVFVMAAKRGGCSCGISGLGLFGGIWDVSGGVHSCYCGILWPLLCSALCADLYAVSHSC